MYAHSHTNTHTHTHTHTYKRAYAHGRSCSRFERDRGHTEGLITRRVCTRATIEGRRRRRRRRRRWREGWEGRERPRGAHKASPRTYPPPAVPLARRRSAAFPQAENARPVPRGSSPGGGIALSLPRRVPPRSSACPPRRAVISSSRSPGLPGRGSAPSCTTARSSVRPLGRCNAPRRSVGRRCGVVGYEKVRGVSGVSPIVQNKCEITAVPVATWKRHPYQRPAAPPGARINKRDDDLARNGAAA